MTKRNETLQSLCRKYLGRLRYMANKHGIDVDTIIHENKSGRCAATQYEVEMLSRCCNDERLSRIDIPALFGKSYYECTETNLFDRIKKLPHVGIYSKVSAMLLKEGGK